MARIGTRFAGPLLLTNSTVTQFTVAALTKAVIRHIHVQNPSVSAVTFTLSIGADAAGVRLFDAYSIAAGTVLDHFCYYIVDAAQIMAAHAGTNNIMTITIDGDSIVLG